MEIRQHENRLTANAADLAADYKYKGLNKYVAWDRFIQDRDLRPEMNASAFYTLFDSIHASLLDNLVKVEFNATHLDADLENTPCQIQDDNDGVHHIIWSFGMTGSIPPSHDMSRFIPIH